MVYMMRGASLANYVEVARSVGLDPYQQLSEAGLGGQCFLNTELLLPSESVSDLLERSAHESGHVDFALRMVRSRQQSELGSFARGLREAPTLRTAIDWMVRFSSLHNEALAIHLDEAGDLVAIRISLVGRPPGALRQSIELSVGVLYRTIHDFLGPHLRSVPTPRQVCFTHASPEKAALHATIFGMAASFNQEFDGLVYRAVDLDCPLNVHDPAGALQARHYLGKG